MRRIILIVIILAAALYFFLVAAVNDDIKWFHSFSKSSNRHLRQKFHSFDFSYNDVFSTCFSIKFTHTDTVFIKQHFASAFSYTPKSGQNYYAILSDSDIQKRDSFINEINFLMLDTAYYEPYADGIEYQFYICKDSVKRLIYVHSDSVPNNVKSFAFWITDLKKKLKIYPVDKIVRFESVRNFIPPKVPEPTIKFTPPKVE